MTMNAINSAIYSSGGASSSSLLNATQNLLQTSTKTFINPEKTVEVDGNEVSLSEMLNQSLAEKQEFGLFASLSGASSAYSTTEALVGGSINNNLSSISKEI